VLHTYDDADGCRCDGNCGTNVDIHGFERGGFLRSGKENDRKQDDGSFPGATVIHAVSHRKRRTAFAVSTRFRSRRYGFFPES